MGEGSEFERAALERRARPASITLIFSAPCRIEMAEAVAFPVLSEVLRQASERIAKKVMEGKKLTDTEVIILLLDQMNRALNQMSKRIDIINESLSERIEDVKVTLDKRVDDVRSELGKRIDDANARAESAYRDLKGDIRMLYQEVSSIKSVVIDLLKERLGKS